MQSKTLELITKLKHYNHGKLIQLLLLVLSKNPTSVLPLLQKYLDLNIQNLQPHLVIYICILRLEKCNELELYTLVLKCAMESCEFVNNVQLEMQSGNGARVLFNNDEQSICVRSNENTLQSAAPSLLEMAPIIAQVVLPEPTSTPLKAQDKTGPYYTLLELANRIMPPDLNNKTLEELLEMPHTHLRAYCCKLKELWHDGTKMIYAKRIYYKFHGVPAEEQALRDKYNKLSSTELHQIRGMPKHIKGKKSLVDYAVDLELRCSPE